MTAAETQPEPATTPRQRLIANIVLVVFSLYVAALFVLALDQQFDWGLFPPKLTKQLTAQVEQLGDTKLSVQQRQTIADDIINWNEFSVPVLIKAIEKNQPGVREPALQCLQAIATKFYNADIRPLGSDPVKLRQWYAELQAKWREAERKANKS